MTLKDLLDSAGIEYYAYSGRGMYGVTCLAINTEARGVNHLLGTIANLIRIANEEDDSAVDVLADALHYAQTDSMGMGTILYFPRILLGRDNEQG